jgi:LysM repeat protein
VRRLQFMFASGIALFTVSAQAQERSDLMPTPPAGGAGTPMWLPGAPAPTPPAAAAGGSGAGTSGGSGGSGGNMNNVAGGGTIAGGYRIDDNSPSTNDPRRVSGGPVPDVHVVKKGDTLWDISSQYFATPWQWPKIWAYNPDITNPHWIYPGDTVRLHAAGDAVASKSKTDDSPAHKISRAGVQRAVFLRQQGFVEPGELKSSGKIVGSPEEKIMLAKLDDMYVEFSKKTPLLVGERYTIYNPVSELHHPHSHKKLGDVVEIFGECEVQSVTDSNIARVRIVDSVNPIERGYHVGPLRRQFRVMQSHPADRDVSGQLVGTLSPVTLIDRDMLVFLDKGRKDGVQVGNRVFVVRRGDGYTPRLSDEPVDDKRYPAEDIAEIVVVDLRDNLSFGFITKGEVEAHVGDRVELRKGQ